MQRQEDKQRFQQHERDLEIERKKAEEDEEQRCLKLELTKGSSRASGSVADEIKKCWIKTQSRKNSRVGRISGSTVCP